jgi:asparagine N-glycosylation enzyme membrane subunit Stt3
VLAETLDTVIQLVPAGNMALTVLVVFQESLGVTDKDTALTAAASTAVAAAEVVQAMVADSAEKERYELFGQEQQELILTVQVNLLENGVFNAKTLYLP